jgi:YidC/Oxa1 family membrane protein insertase
VEGAFKRVALASLEAEPQTVTTARAGVEDQYFVAMFLSAEPVSVKVTKQEHPGPDGKPLPTLSVSAAVRDEKRMGVYVGPKQQDWLSKADPQLTAVQDYGYFEFIAKPLLKGLLWINKYVGNYGWSIILLTVVINLVIFPLMLKQQVSMLKMQKIQPHMRRLQDQYKKLKANDPRRTQVQAEMMGLYKQHGVNPMGGCLPLLLQMPFFFGFYSALAYSIELRRAPWILWINDLSQYDPYYMLPILMAVAMIIQQKLTPTANLDPAQARMMMLMPVVMTFMFLRVSSGLALYWLTGSLVGLVQQVFMNKYWSPQAEAKLNARSKPNEPRGA